MLDVFDLPNNTIPKFKKLETETVSAGSYSQNANLVLSPKGTGSIIGGPAPDGLAKGGNARGLYSIDLQTTRTAATQVASGDYNIVIGANNTASGTANSTIGTYNIIIGTNSTIAANANANEQSIVIGNGSSITQNLGSIVIGNGASSSGYRAVAIGSGALCGGGVAIGQNANATIGGGAAIGSGSATYFPTSVGTYMYPMGQINASTGYSGINTSLVTRTVDNIPKALGIPFNTGDGSPPYTYWTMPAGFAMTGTCIFTAVNSSGTNTCRFARSFSAINRGGTSTLKHLYVDGTDYVGISGCSVDIQVLDASDSIRFIVTGTPAISGVTASAATDILSATGHPFVDNDLVIFTTIAAGGSGLGIHDPSLPRYYYPYYYVTSATVDTFKLYTSTPSSPINIMTDMTGGIMCMPVRWSARIEYQLLRYGY